MTLVATGLTSLLRIVDDVDGAAVVFDEFGDVVLYNAAASALDGASCVERSSLTEERPLRAVQLAVPGREDPVELVATMYPVESPLGRVVAVLGVLEPSALRARATLERAAGILVAAAAREPATNVMVFDTEHRVVVSTGSNPPALASFCEGALLGEVCRLPRCAECSTELRSGPIRDSLGFIVGGLLVAYDDAGHRA